MRGGTTFLRSKVARRIFLLFVLCAMLPIGVLSVLSFREVSAQLRQMSQRRLMQATKAAGMSIAERLDFCEADLRQIAAQRAQRARPEPGKSATGGLRDLEERFSSIVLIRANSAVQTVLGGEHDLPAFDPAEWEHLRGGRTLLSTANRDGVPQVWMSRGVNPQRPEEGVLAGALHPDYLWSRDTLPEMNELTVLDDSGQALVESGDTDDALRQAIRTPSTGRVSGQFAWESENGRYLASFWSLFLKPRFHAPRWTIILSEPASVSLRPLAEFQSVFPLTILLSLWVVLLLSLIQIRRNLVPLERLQEGTEHIANREFEARVKVTSGDEFQQLAASFNSMAERLGRQFHALVTINEIDRAILSSLDSDRVVQTVLERMGEVVPCDMVAVGRLVPSPERTLRIRFRPCGAGQETQQVDAALKPEHEHALYMQQGAMLVYGQGSVPGYLEPLAALGMESFLILPVFLQERLNAIIAVAHASRLHLNQDDIQQARQVADQVAVALSNTRLLAEIDRMHWGTLRALARAIDAKSPWTAGHSDRVTEMAMRIGRQLRLPESEIEILHRGGLLHDIGKIGVPANILNKPAHLDSGETQVMREHVRIGVRILEPLPGFGDVLPIVLQHHEWFDGSGYPDGRAGEAISFHARIFAVADVYDALISERPYRPGWAPAAVLAYIREKAGAQFDPRVVQAFLEITGESGAEEMPEPDEEMHATLMEAEVGRAG